MDPVILLLLGIVVIIISILILKLHPVLALLFAALVVGLMTSESNLEQYALSKGMTESETTEIIHQSLGKRIAIAFGDTASKIGILIAMAAIIGNSLLRSGAADRIIRGTLNLTGVKRAPVAFLSSGFILGIPVFFDTVFYLLVPLGKAMTLRTGKHYLFYLMAIVAGAAMAHSLVPPTPGPLFVATEIGVDMGVMIIGGLVVGIFTITSGYLYAAWANRKWTIPLRDTSDVSIAELENLMEKESRQLPALWLSLMPILLPVILISGNTITRAIQADGILLSLFSFLGDPNIALTLSAFVALGILAWHEKDKKRLRRNVIESLQSAGLIILITSMGGAFGGILQQTGVGARIQELSGNYQMAILPLAFFVTVLMKTAQGSATVAMITSVGILGGLASMGELSFHPVYLALIIGCGSKPIPWMNDSGFWVVSKMSGMTEGEALKTYTMVLSIMGFVGMIVVLILAKLFPLV
jgi:GntP family gluconate:H+ symporter